MKSGNYIRNNRSAILTTALCMVLFALNGSAKAQRYSGWSAPENLGDTVNSAAFDGCPSLTKDGLNLLFMSGVNSSALNLYVSNRESKDGPWNEPASLGSTLNTSTFNEGCPVLSISGRYLYFMSDRPGGCGNYDIYVSRRLDKQNFTEWSEPENLGCEVNSSGPEFSPSLFEDEDGTTYLYFSSGARLGGLGFGDIWISRQVGDVFAAAEPVTALNTASNDLRPKIRARDGLEIFFDSNRPGSMLQDIYTSTRECTICPWSTPISLGATVNSSGVDGGAALSFDGTELYFMSDRADPDGFGGQDLYVIKRETLTN